LADLQRESILTLDNIRLDLPIAGIGSRTLAAIVDYLCLAVLWILWILASLLTFVALKDVPWVATWAPVVNLGGLFLLDWGYFAGQEIATGGRTLGKRALKLRVLTAEGGAPGAWALLARNLVRSLDLVFGIPLMALDPLARRLGDRLAGTLVVHDRGREAALFIGRVPPGWGPRELTLVEALLARAGTMDDAGRVRDMAEQVLRRIERDAPELLARIDTRSDPVAAIRRALEVEEG